MPPREEQKQERRCKALLLPGNSELDHDAISDIRRITDEAGLTDVAFLDDAVTRLRIERDSLRSSLQETVEALIFIERNSFTEKDSTDQILCGTIRLAREKACATLSTIYKRYPELKEGE